MIDQWSKKLPLNFLPVKTEDTANEKYPIENHEEHDRGMKVDSLTLIVHKANQFANIWLGEDSTYRIHEHIKQNNSER